MDAVARRRGVCFSRFVAASVISVNIHHSFAMGEECKLQDFEDKEKNSTSGGLTCDTGCCLADNGTYRCCQELKLTRGMLYGIIVTITTLTVAVFLYYRLRRITQKLRHRRHSHSPEEDDLQLTAEELRFFEPPPPYWSCVSGDSHPPGGATEAESGTTRFSTSSLSILSSAAIPTSSFALSGQGDTDGEPSPTSSGESNHRSLGDGVLLRPLKLSNPRGGISDPKPPPSYEEVEGMFPEIQQLRRGEGGGTVVVVFPGPHSRQVSEQVLKVGKSSQVLIPGKARVDVDKQ